MTRLIGALLLVLVASGCGSDPTPTPPPPTTWLQFADQNKFWAFLLAAFLIVSLMQRGKP